MAGVVTHLQRLKDGCLDTLFSRFACWTKLLRISLPLATLTDLGRSKSELIAENALLRKPSHRSQATSETANIHQGRSHPSRPVGQVGSNLAAGPLHRSTRSIAALASGALSPVVETQVKDRFSQSQGSCGNHCLDQADGEGESTVGC
jgi:hypothetical protein